MTDYTKLDQEVDAVAGDIWDMASKVWEFAELGFEEVQSSVYEAGMLKKHGFDTVDKGTGGIDTAWVAQWGSGSPVIGILVEFDALPGLGNDTVPTKTPAKSGNTNGHGCGHNLIGSGAIGAAIALKAHMEKEGTGHNLLQALVLLLERLQLRKLRPHHATELLAPGVVARVTDSHGPAGRRNVTARRQTYLDLAQQLHNVLVGMPLSGHRSLLSTVAT